jgi:xylan 1,4-beta-xylosidase
MGSPKEPTPRQYVEPERAGHLEMIGNPQTVSITAGAANVKLKLPRQGVSLLVFTW